MSIDTTQHRRFGTQALVPALALLILLGAGCSEKETASPQDAASAPQIAEPGASPPAEAPEPTNEPDASQAAAEPPAADKPADTQTGSVDGQKIYQKSCQVCHAAGVAGAPKLGDKDAWAPRIAKGNDALFFIGQERTQSHAAERYLHELQRGRVARSHGIHAQAGFLIVATETDYFHLRGIYGAIRYAIAPASLKLLARKG